MVVWRIWSVGNSGILVWGNCRIGRKGDMRIRGFGIGGLVNWRDWGILGLYGCVIGGWG